MGQAKIELVGSCMLGLFTPVITRVLSDTLSGGGNFGYFLPPITVGIFSWVLATKAQCQPKMSVVLLYIMLPFGVIMDIMIDGALNKVDRNLFPLEILFWLVLAPLPIWIGYLLRMKSSKAGT